MQLNELKVTDKAAVHFAPASACRFWFQGGSVAIKKRKKIQYCYEDFCKTVSEEERLQHRKKFAALVEIIYSSEDDNEIMAQARAYDAAHGTDLFSEAINFKIYCLACHRVDCICC